MKKLFCLLASIFYAVCILLIPALIFICMEPSGTALFLACILSAVSGLASYNYFLNYKNK